MYVQTNSKTIVDAFGAKFKRNEEAEIKLRELLGTVDVFVAARAVVTVDDKSVHTTDAIIIKRENIFIYVSGIRTEELVFRKIKVTPKRKEKQS